MSEKMRYEDMLDLCVCANAQFDEQIRYRSYWDGTRETSLTSSRYVIIPQEEAIAVFDKQSGGELVASICR
jgi:hypothetical protein